MIVDCLLVRPFDDLLSIHPKIAAFAEVSLTDLLVLFVTFLQILEAFVDLHFLVLDEPQDLIELHTK